MALKIKCMSNRIVLAISGASGSIYPKLIIEKFLEVKDKWEALSVVMSNNAKDIWKSEIGNEDYLNYPVSFYDKYDFSAPFASGSLSAVRPIVFA